MNEEDFKIVLQSLEKRIFQDFQQKIAACYWAPEVDIKPPLVFYELHFDKGVYSVLVIAQENTGKLYYRYYLRAHIVNGKISMFLSDGDFMIRSSVFGLDEIEDLFAVFAYGIINHYHRDGDLCFADLADFFDGWSIDQRNTLAMRLNITLAHYMTSAPHKAYAGLPFQTFLQNASFNFFTKPILWTNKVPNGLLLLLNEKSGVRFTRFAGYSQKGEPREYREFKRYRLGRLSKAMQISDQWLLVRTDENHKIAIDFVAGSGEVYSFVHPDIFHPDIWYQTKAVIDQRIIDGGPGYFFEPGEFVDIGWKESMSLI